MMNDTNPPEGGTIVSIPLPPAEYEVKMLVNPKGGTIVSIPFPPAGKGVRMLMNPNPLGHGLPSPDHGLINRSGTTNSILEPKRKRRKEGFGAVFHQKKFSKSS